MLDIDILTHLETVEAVSEKFDEQNFRVLSEMRILGKNRVVILDFGRVCLFLKKIDAKSDFRVWGLGKLGSQDQILGFRV